MKKFRLTFIEKGPECSFYSVIIDDSEVSEFEKFLHHFSATRKNDIHYLIDSIDKIANRFGPREQFFRHEKDKNVFRFRLYKEKNSNLRLYCLRLGSCIIVIGDGAEKNTNTWQEDPKLIKIIENLSRIDKFIEENDINIEEACTAKTVFTLGV